MHSLQVAPAAGSGGQSAPRLAVAVSGGRDSTALLHCTVRQARELGIEVVALHVHHGLMPQADAWLAQVRQQSQRWGASFACRRLQGPPPRGESIEAWARTERYRALAALAQGQGADCVLLAHHRRDQAETWLLQALRGGGPAGLSAMPRVAQRHGITWARPWLDMPPPAIDAYVRRHRLSHVQDDSNADPRFARSRLRTQVWPALQAAFADAEQGLAAAARRAQEAQALAQEAAAADLSVLVGDAGLQVAPWLDLPPARRLNALRAWLSLAMGASPPQSLVARLMDELPHGSAGQWPGLSGRLRRYRGWLRWDAAGAGPAVPPPDPVSIDLSQPGDVAVPSWQGHWTVRAVDAGGVAVGALRQLSLRARQGQEQIRLQPKATARSLKKQFQAQGVPAWQRPGPLLFTPGGQLVFVPGLGPDAAFLAAPGQPQRQLQWVPDAAAPTGQRQGPG
jgi:tRNA(Ile)-lysidine synthase